MPAEQKILYRPTKQILRNFPTEEFKLNTHRENKEFPVYAMVVAKKWLKAQTICGQPVDVRFG